MTSKFIKIFKIKMRSFNRLYPGTDSFTSWAFNLHYLDVKNMSAV